MLPGLSSVTTLRTCRQTSLGPVLWGVRPHNTPRSFDHLSSPWTIELNHLCIFLSALSLYDPPPTPETLPHCGLEFELNHRLFLSSSQKCLFPSCSKWTDSPLRKLLAFHSALWRGSYCVLKDSWDTRPGGGGEVFFLFHTASFPTANPHLWMSCH